MRSYLTLPFLVQHYLFPDSKVRASRAKKKAPLAAGPCAFWPNLCTSKANIKGGTEETIKRNSRVETMGKGGGKSLIFQKYIVSAALDVCRRRRRQDDDSTVAFFFSSHRLTFPKLYNFSELAAGKASFIEGVCYLHPSKRKADVHCPLFSIAGSSSKAA